MQIVPPQGLPVASATPAQAAAHRLEIDDEDLRVLDNLERLSLGEEPTDDSMKIRPAQLVASLIRLLMKKGLIAEDEFLDELSRK